MQSRPSRSQRKCLFFIFFFRAARTVRSKQGAFAFQTGMKDKGSDRAHWEPRNTFVVYYSWGCCSKKLFVSVHQECFFFFLEKPAPFCTLQCASEIRTQVGSIKAKSPLKSFQSIYLIVVAQRSVRSYPLKTLSVHLRGEIKALTTGQTMWQIIFCHFIYLFIFFSSAYVHYT